MKNLLWQLLENLSGESDGKFRSEERFSRNAETDIVCRLLLEKKEQLARAGRAWDGAWHAENDAGRTARTGGTHTSAAPARAGVARLHCGCLELVRSFF